MFKRSLIPFIAATLVVVFAIPAAAAPPDAVTGLSVTAGADSISASWTAPANDGGFPVTSYTVDLSGAAVDSTSVAGTSASFGGLAPGDYTVTVTAVNVDGPGAGASGSATIAAPVVAPGAPTGVTVSVVGQTVTVDWVAPADNGGDAAITYNVSFGAESNSTSATDLTFGNVASGTYTASVTATNAGGTSPAGTSASFVVADPVTAPSPATGVTASVSGQTVTVSWTASADDGGDPDIAYVVSFGAESNQTDGTSLVFNNVAPGTYTAGVVASNSGGSAASAASGSFTVNAPVTAPSAPQSVSASVSGQSVTVTWAAPADNGGDAAITYNVSAGGQSTTSTGTSVTFNNVTPGTYTASVTATNGGGTSAAGTSASFTVDAPVTAPSAPQSVSVSVSGQSITVTWAAPADNGGDAAITYNVSAGGQSTSTAGTSATFNNVTPGTYTASVTATNGGGTSAAGTSASFTVDAPIGAPSAPQSVSASVSGQSITVTWAAPADNGGDAAITYNVSAGGQSTSTAGTSATFNNVTPGTYTASVTATNGGGTSAAGTSASFTVDAPIGAPSAPQSVSASVSGQSVTVTWAAPADNGGDASITYEISISGVTPTSTTGLSATFTNVPAGNYTATVTASNAAGEGGSANSNSVTVEAPATTPGVPTDLTAIVNGLDVLISWVAPANNGSPISSYRLTVNGAAQTVTGTDVTLTNLTPGNYSVTIAATNGVGTGSASAAEAFTIAQPIVPPGPPTNVNAAVSGQTVTVTWTASNNGNDPDGVTYSVSIAGGPSRADITGTSTVFNGVGAGNFTVTVTATNAAGTSSAGSDTFSIFTAPSAPRDLVAAADGSAVVATWSAPSNLGNGSLLGYTAQLVQNGSVLETQDVGPDTSSIRFDNRSPGLYSVVLRARNGQGAGSAISVDVEVGTTNPSAPSNVSATARFQTVTITWGPPLSVGNTALTGYEVTVGDIVQTVTAGTRSVVLVDVPPGTYVAEVRAVNAGGKGLPGESGSFKSETLFSPFESSEDLVSQQYLDFLGRPPDAAGVAYWQGILGSDRSQGPIVIENFMRSAEFAPRRSIARLYLAFFDRAPDRDGFDFWAQTVRNGGQLNDIAAAFAGSAEFRATYGELNDAEFIALVYNNVLLRTPDLDGFRFWLDRLNDPGVTRGDLMVAFSESAEFKRNSNPAVDVIMTYRGMLDRAPDPEGFSFWVGEIAGSRNALQILILNFLVSEEYSNRVR